MDGNFSSDFIDFLPFGIKIRRKAESPTTIFTAMIKYFMRVTGCCSFVERSGYVYGEP